MKALWQRREILRFIITLQEAFAAIVPFFLLSSLTTLLYYFTAQYHPEWFLVSTESLRLLMVTLHTFSSLAAVSAIAYFMAKRIETSRIMAVLLSLAVFVTLVLMESPAVPLALPYGFSAATLFAPLAATPLLRFFYPYFALHLPLENENRHVFRFFSYMFVFLAAYAATVLLYSVADTFMDEELEALGAFMQRLPVIVAYFLRDFLVQLSWFIGIHGAHMTNALLGKEMLIRPLYPNLSFSEFNHLFVTMGGAGAGAALLLALLYQARDRAYLLLGKISIPFVLFNINTLLIYPLVVFNRRLFLPFIAVPLLNFLLAWLFLALVPIHFSTHFVPWTTPILLDGYLKSDGDLRIVLFQLFLLGVDTGIYSHYLHRFFQTHSLRSRSRILETNLNVRSRLSAGSGLKAYAAHKEILEANNRLEEILPTLTEENLFVYYQPKIDVRSGRCESFEALMRYRQGERIVGPFFLDIVEQAGLAPILDLWVAEQIRRQLDLWETEDFRPEVSINLHPDTLSDSEGIDAIVRILQGRKIVVEIIERSFLAGEEAMKNLQKIRQAGFSISIDDFGVGYSNLETIANKIMDELKLDKALVDTLETDNGTLVCRKVVELCHDIGCRVVAEGVERKEQVQKLEAMGVDYLQGYFYAPALPPEEAKNFSQRRR